MGNTSASIRFVVAFTLIASTFLGLYYFPYADGGAMKTGLNAYLHGYALSAGTVLGWVEPHVAVTGQDIVGRTSLRIVRTCDAMDVTILLLAAIVSWPSSSRRRALGAVAGVSILFIVNVVRICSLYYVGVYCPAAFELAHLELWPAIILLVAVGLFVGSIRMGRELPARRASNALA